MKKKLMYIFGTRPEAVKICPLIKETADRSCFENIFVLQDNTVIC